MRLKKNVFRSLIFASVVFFTFSGCKAELPSPEIVNVNVVNENLEELKNCNFSAILDGKDLTDLNYDIEEYSAEFSDFDVNTGKISDEVRKVRHYYNLYSFKFSKVLKDMGDLTYKYDEIADLYSRIKITVNCEGYETLIFTPVVKDSSYGAENISVQLNKK